MSEKIICNQCKNCAVENTTVLDCSDDNCRCHTKKEVTSLSTCCNREADKIIAKTVYGKPFEILVHKKIMHSILKSSPFKENRELFKKECEIKK